MKQVINYNPMLMMLYNLDPNILVVGFGSNFDKNEINLLKHGANLQTQNKKLNLAFMNLATVKQTQQGVYSLNTMVYLASHQDMLLDYFINYFMSDSADQKDIFASIKSLLNVQKVVVNDDFKINDQKINQKVLAQIFGQENVILVKSISPTEKINQVKQILNDGNVSEYFKLTKTYFQLKGEVVHGKEVGRLLGFPTANIKVNDWFGLKQGVYYVKVKLPNDEHLYNAMSCYWVNELNDHVVETYLFDFDKDIYGWFIELQFIDFIRDNVITSDQQELIKLLTNDAKWVKKHQK